MSCLCWKILLYILCIFVIGPAIMTVLDNLEYNCRQNSILYYYGYVDEKQCKQLENMYIDMILNKVSKFLDCIINLSISIGGGIEDLIIWFYCSIIHLFYRKEETLIDKFYGLVHKVFPTKPTQTNIAKMITPYLDFANRGLSCLLSLRPTCLTICLSKLLVCCMNPIPPLIFVLCYLIYDNVWRPYKCLFCKGILKRNKRCTN